MEISIVEAKVNGKTKSPDSSKLIHEVNGKDFYNKVAKAHRLSILLETTKLAYEALQSELKNEAMQAYIDLYVNNGSNPGSITLATEQVAGKSYSFMYTPQDAYKKIDEATYDSLTKAYGKDVADKETVYKLDSKLYTKHKAKITKAISGIEGIPDAERVKLFSSSTVCGVKKGTINGLLNLVKGKNIKDKLVMLISDISPNFLFKELKETALEPSDVLTLKKTTKK